MLNSNVWNHLIVYKRIIIIRKDLLVSSSNTWNLLILCKQMINII